MTCETCGRLFRPDRANRGVRFCSRRCIRTIGRRSPRRDATERFWSKVDRSGDCWLWKAGVNRSGYGRFQLGRGRTEGVVLAHRFAYQLTCGAFDESLFVCHRCDTPGCVRPDHLFLGTDRENKNDAGEKGRIARGTRIGNAKLTEAQVLTIRQRYADGGISQAALAREYGMSTGSLNRIVKRIDWAHVP